MVGGGGGWGGGGVVFFFQAEDGIRDRDVTGSSDVCSSDLLLIVVLSLRPDNP